MQNLFLLTLLILLIILIFFIRVPGEKGNQKNFKLRLSYWIPFMMGIRLLLAGIVQITNPSYTAKLTNVSTDCSFIIREVGFANIVFGLLGIGQIFIKDTKTRALISGSLTLFIIQATIQHTYLDKDMSVAFPNIIQSILLIASTYITLNLE